MWLYIKNNLQGFINKGTEHFSSFEDYRRVRLINVFVLLVGFVLLPVMFIFKLSDGLDWEITIILLFFSMFLLIMYLNHRGKIVIATLFSLVPTIAVTYFVVLFAENQTAAPYVNLSIGLAAFYLIKNNLLKYMVAVTGFVSFFILNYYQLVHLPFREDEYLVIVLVVSFIFIGISLFETEVSNYRKQIDEKNLKLTDLNREKDGMLGIVAHDLRGPFNHIKGLVSIMGMTGKQEPEQQDIMERIDSSIVHANMLINDLLDINNFQTEDAKPKIEEVDVGDFLTKLKERFENMACKKEQIIDFKVEVISNLHTDKILLTRMLENLVSNAIKFSPPKSTIGLAGWQTGNEFVFSVKDEGPGFTVRDKIKMFGKFQKLSATPTGGEQSTGLGLSIVKSICDRLQGSIELFTNPGKGSEFVVMLSNTVVEHN